MSDLNLQLQTLTSPKQSINKILHFEPATFDHVRVREGRYRASWIPAGMSCWIGVAIMWNNVSAFDVGIQLYGHGDVA